MSSGSEPEEKKIPLAQFLKYLTSGNIPMTKAMALAGKIYKTNCTPSKLRDLNDFTLTDCGITEASDRKLVLAAVRKAGFKPVPKTPLRRVKKQEDDDELPAVASNAEAGPSKLPGASPPRSSSKKRKSEAATEPLTAVEAMITPARRKRVKLSQKNEFLPEGPSDEAVDLGNLEFNEILDEEELKSKFVVINRAPVMTAWSMVVAECLGFSREEALSIASVYTEMNAISRGINLGIYKADKEQGIKSGSQPYVELMGRRPLYQTQEGRWRALSNGSPVPPINAFTYICRSFRQTTPFVIGALRLLAQSYTCSSLNQRGYSLYCDFRPETEEWGKRSELSCAKILGLRREGEVGEAQAEATHREVVNADAVPTEPPMKDENGDKPKLMSLEEYEAALDDDHTFDEVEV
ncbi:hypothetical protein BKA70DRAFT_1258806 [Coprinopsis sp. MPI-PUGE-AT-0042]|nr:hypothetical protein BKA70DRAFT_1258806 [Coprinopsis sp. MPI-PUGE-AT-0042]